MDCHLKTRGKDETLTTDAERGRDASRVGTINDLARSPGRGR